MISTSFLDICGIDFWCNSGFCHNLLKTPKCLYIKHFGGFSTLKIPLFPCKNPQTIQAFSGIPSCTFLFRVFMQYDTKMMDFGRLPGPQLAPKGYQKSFKYWKMPSQNVRCALKSCSWNRLACKLTFGAIQATILSDFRWILEDMMSVWLGTPNTNNTKYQ